MSYAMEQIWRIYMYPLCLTILWNVAKPSGETADIDQVFHDY